MVDQWLVFLQHTEKMKIINNCIEKKLQDDLYELLLGKRIFPWYFSPDITDGIKDVGEQKRPALHHYFIDDDKGAVSNFLNTTTLAPLMAMNCDSNGDGSGTDYGSILHSAFQPNKNVRCVINFNIKKEI